MTLSAKPDFKAIEAKWQKFWLDEKIFKFNKTNGSKASSGLAKRKFSSESSKKVFSIDAPPPTVSGDLHIGHAASYTHFDIMGHYMRQCGFNVLQPIGFDDNGHPTERFVEKMHNIDSKRMQKEEFNAIVRKEIPKCEETFKKDLIALGHGYDWDLTYSTISPESIKLVQLSFLDLYKKNLAYRKEAPTIWCVKCQTALAQADIEDMGRDSTLNYINFELENKKTITVATSRPELLPACVGIFVHPEDSRYKKIVGKIAKVPLFGQEVKIMEDEKVDPAFGTGIVMICTFGDKTDIEWWKKYNLPLRIAITKDGKMNLLAGKYAGLKFEEAKKQIIEDLRSANLLVKQEPLRQTVGTCWRCHTLIEFIVTKQWFIKLLENKEKFKELGRKIKWHPSRHFKLYESWVDGLSQDWLISRQRHFGPAIPAWYCKKCDKEILPDEKDLPLDPEKDKPKLKCSCGSDEFKPEHDVFDTWMTSSLTPQLVIGWDNKKLGNIFPMTVRPSARDIIRTWEFYTIVKSWYHYKDLPWTNTLISGMVYDPFTKEVMHKSKGGGVSPQAVVEKYGADAFRCWSISSMIGEDIWYQEKELTHAQKLIIKLWNVAKFVELWKTQAEQSSAGPSKIKNFARVKPKKIESKNIIDQWITSRLNQVLKKYRESFDNYDPVTARRELENFFWQEYCDFYLEMIKYRLYGKDETSKAEAEQTLHHTFCSILKMFAPIMPHITEEIYRELFQKSEKTKSIHISDMPEVAKYNKEALELGKLAVDVIIAIRKWKANNKISLGAEVEKLTVQHPQNEELEKVKLEIAATMRIKNLELEKGELKVL